MNDKCLMYTSFLLLFYHIFRRIMCLVLLFILLFWIYAWVWLLVMFCRILGLFTWYLTFHGCILISPMNTHMMLLPWSRKRAANWFQPWPRLDRGVWHGPRWVEKLLPLHLPLAVWLKTSELSYERSSFSSRKEGHMYRDTDRKQARVA